MRKEVIKKVLTGMILLCSLTHLAQQMENEADKKYTPNPNSIFNNLSKKNSDNGGGSDDITFRNSIGVCPTMIARQKVFVSGAFDLGHGICLNPGIGKSFGRDYLESAFLSIFSFGDYDDKVITAGALFTNSNASFNGSSPLLSLAARVYFSGKTFDGGYIDFTYRYERTNYRLNSVVNGIAVSGGNDLRFTMNGAYFTAGSTLVSNKFTHDFYVSLGIKFLSYTRYDKVSYTTGYNSYYEYVRSNATLAGRIFPAISMGYIFGFGF